MSGRRPGSRPTDQEVLSDDCNTCDLLGATAKGMLTGPPSRASSARPSSAAQTSPVATSSQAPVESTEEKWASRPAPGITEIGNAGWTTIHSFAAYYPDKPNDKQRESAKNLIDSFAELFPCRWCAGDLKDHVSKFPVRTESRTAFSQWTCEAHNHVNEHLGKPLFDCTRFDELWRRYKPKTDDPTKGGF